MGWVLMSLRQTELQTSINDIQYELLQLNREKRKLSSFSTAVGDGQITPSEIASLGSNLFGDALDFMGYSNEAASQLADEQTNYYTTAYDTVTQDQYNANPALASQAQLYFDESGNLDQQAMYGKFYEEALEEFVQQYIAPILKEKEQEMETRQTELETQLESMEQELQVVKDSKSQAIQNSTIKLS